MSFFLFKEIYFKEIYFKEIYFKEIYFKEIYFFAPCFATAFILASIAAWSPR